MLILLAEKALRGGRSRYETGAAIRFEGADESMLTCKVFYFNLGHSTIIGRQSETWR